MGIKISGLHLTMAIHSQHYMVASVLWGPSWCCRECAGVKVVKMLSSDDFRKHRKRITKLGSKKIATEDWYTDVED